MHSCEARAVLRGSDTKPAAHAALPGPAGEPAGGGAGVGIPVTAAGLEQPARRHLPEPGRPPPHRSSRLTGDEALPNCACRVPA